VRWARSPKIVNLGAKVPDPDKLDAPKGTGQWNFWKE
jgi:hypothetical protein